MKKRLTSCLKMTEGVVKDINKNIATAKENRFSTDDIKALSLGSIVQILSSIAYSLATISDYLTSVDITKEEDK